LCLNLRNAYAEAIQRAKRCTPGAPGACAMKTWRRLGCGGGCETWVTEARELTPLRERFVALNCLSMCPFDSPTGDRCHPVGCPDLGNAVCMATASGQGTCVDMERDRTCPPGTASGTPCPAVNDHCVATPMVCTCPSNLRWSCFGGAARTN
jgi:hypothetical protein